MGNRVFVALLVVLMTAGTVNADTYHFTGTISYHNDIALFHFSLLNDGINVRVWTDSFEDGANFDPMAALWENDGDLIAENDDDSNVNPATQTYYDAGFTLASLAAGDYFLTVAAYDNFAQGTNIADGFLHDGETPIPITDWWFAAPGYYSVWFDSVNQVPEPGTILLLGSGVAALVASRRKLKR